MRAWERVAPKPCLFRVSLHHLLELLATFTLMFSLLCRLKPLWNETNHCAPLRWSAQADLPISSFFPSRDHHADRLPPPLRVRPPCRSLCRLSSQTRTLHPVPPLSTYTERSRGPSPDGGRTAFVATHRQQGQEGFLSSSFHSQDNQEGQFVCATGGHRWKTVEERDP